MPILGTIASSTRQGLSTNSYESIASITLTSTSASISFTSIPNTYKHLEIRGALRQGGSGNYFNGSRLTFNNDTTNANYWWHRFRSDDGLGVGSGNDRASMTSWENGVIANTFSAFFGQILDYTSTNKIKNFKFIEMNEDGSNSTYEWNAFRDVVWNSTSAVSQIDFTPIAGDWQAGCTVALYGIKD